MENEEARRQKIDDEINKLVDDYLRVLVANIQNRILNRHGLDIADEEVIAKKTAGRAEVTDRKVKKPIWEPCELCEDMGCNFHEMHAWECDCPGIDEWFEVAGDHPMDIPLSNYPEDFKP